MEENYCHACKLQFSNPDLYHKHRIKFCPYQNSKSNTNWHWNTQNNFQATNGDGGITSHRVTSNGGIGSTISSRGFANKATEFKLGNSHKINVSDLIREEELLEKEKEEILQQLDSLQSSFSQKTANGRKSSKKGSRKKSDASGSNIPESVSTYASPGAKSGKKVNTSIPQNRENQLLKNVKEMYKDYIDNGGEDQEVIDYFRTLQKDMERFEEKTLSDVEKLVHNLQKQVEEYQSVNESLRCEVDSMKNQQHAQLKKPTPQPSRTYQIPDAERTQTVSALNRVDHENYHSRRLMDMRQEAEMYRQQLELEHLRQELNNMRGQPNKNILPLISPHHNSILHNHTQPHDVINTTNDLYQLNQHEAEEAFVSAPFDPGTGFTVFWDFVSAPDRPCDCCRLLVTLYKNGDPVSDTKTLPSIVFSPYGQGSSGNNSFARVPGSVGILGVKQMFPQCFPMTELTLCVCLQTGTRQSSFDTTGPLTDIGWCKIDLFDNFNRLVSGRWKVPVRVLPLRAELTVSQLNTVSQLGQTEIYYRLINSRSVKSQEGTLLVPQLMTGYKYPPLESYPVFALPPQMATVTGPAVNVGKIKTPVKESRSKPRRSVLPPTITPVQKLKPDEKTEGLNHQPVAEPVQQPQEPPPTDDEKVEDEPLRTETAQDNPATLSLPSLSHLTTENDVGFQIDRVMDLPHALTKVTLSVYNPDGKLAHTANGKAQFSTKYVTPTFLEKVHAYGLDTCVFTSLQWYRWSIVVIEVCTKVDDSSDELVGWCVKPLCENENEPMSRLTSLSRGTLTAQSILDPELLPTGLFDIQLFKPPILTPKEIIYNHRSKAQYGVFLGSSITIHMFNENTQKLGSPSKIPAIPRRMEPPNSWINYTRVPPQELFKSGKGFDVYIDAGRFFPDSTIATRIVLGFYDGTTAGKKGDPFRYRYETNFNLDTHSLEPVFDFRVEFRDFAFKPHSKLILLVFMVDAITGVLSLLGRSIVPVFVKPDTFEPATTDMTDFCLNAGNFQLRLYQQLDDKVTFDPSKLSAPVPCSSLLLRVIDAPCYSDGEPKRSREFPEDELAAQGLLVPMPSYEEGHYDSHECSPSDAEKEMLYSFVGRTLVTVRDNARLIAPDGRKTRSDVGLKEFLETRFKIQKTMPLFNMNYLMKYNAMYGFFVWIRKAQNILWKGFTFGSYCISPPGSFYGGIIDDPVLLLNEINLDSLQRHPEWLLPAKVFPRRCFHPNLSIVVQLYEAALSRSNEFVITPVAWTLFPLFTGEYLLQGEFQVPLFQGAPSKTVIAELQDKPIIPTVAALRKKKVLKIADGSSVFIRLGDARKIEDATDQNMQANTSFLPNANKFRQPVASVYLKDTVPTNVQPAEFIGGMNKAFRGHISETFKQRAAGLSAGGT